MEGSRLCGGAGLMRLALIVVLAALSGGKRGGAGETTRAERQARADDMTRPAHERGKAVEDLAKDYDPPALVPWLRERLAREQDFHVRLALAYALAAQGESEGLPVLVDALARTGHLGYVFLTEVSDVAFGGPGKG